MPAEDHPIGTRDIHKLILDAVLAELTAFHQQTNRFERGERGQLAQTIANRLTIKVDNWLTDARQARLAWADEQDRNAATKSD